MSAVSKAVREVNRAQAALAGQRRTPMVERVPGALLNARDRHQRAVAKLRAVMAGGQAGRS